MECLATEETTEAAKKAHELMDELKTLGESDSRYEPNVYTFASLIKAHTRLNQPREAQKVLEGAPPNVMLMTAVLHAWSRSRDNDKPVHALKLLQEMKKTIQPTTISYNAAIEACSRSRHPASLKIAFAVFQSLEKDPNVQPDYWTFVNLFGAIQRALPTPSAERNDIAGAVFKKARDLQVVHRKNLKQLVHVVDADYLRELLHPHMSPGENGKYDFERIPLSWSRNAQY